MTQKKNIAFMHSSLDHFGGAERIMITVANTLAIQGKANIFLFEEIHRGPIEFPIHRDIVSDFVFDKNSQNDLIEDLKKNNKLEYYMCIIRMIRRHNIDTIIINGDLFSAIAVSGHMNGITSMAWIHTFAGHQACQRLSKILAKQSKDIIVLTQKDKKVWEEEYHPKGNVVCIPNMIVLPPKAILEKPYDVNNKTILAVGRLSPQKGFHFLLDIWEGLMDNPKYQDWNVVIRGNPFFEDYARDLIGRSRKLKRCDVLPATPDIYNVYGQAGIFAFPSQFEGLPLSLIEAQASGLPAVSFDINSGPSDIIVEKFTGFLAKPFRLAEFSWYLQLLMDNPHLRMSFSRMAKIRGARFSPHKILPLWNRLLGLE